MRKTLFALQAAFLFLLISCSQKKTSQSFTAMNTYMTVSLYSSSAKKGQEVCRQIQNRIVELEGLLSATLPSSEVYNINHSEGLPSSFSADLQTLLNFSLELYQKTGGAFNPALYPVIREWGFTTGDYKVPSQEHIEKLLQHTDFSKLYEDEKIELDFGAVGKGYAADQALLILKENGIKSALLDFGGNIQALGSKPDGSSWKIGIKNPWDGGVACALSIESKAVVTSGGYERYFEKDGQKYIHIFDPASGHPSQSDLESVTIVCESGKYADALSTALFVMGRAAAINFWRANPDFDFILITKSGSLLYSAGLEAFIEPLYQFESVESVCLN